MLPPALASDEIVNLEDVGLTQDEKLLCGEGRWLPSFICSFKSRHCERQRSVDAETKLCAVEHGQRFRGYESFLDIELRRVDVLWLLFEEQDEMRRIICAFKCIKGTRENVDDLSDGGTWGGT
jgi:hypothetical protein